MGNMNRASQSVLPSLLVTIALLFTCIPLASADINVAYCSSQNTGESSPDIHDIYQSHGACNTSCKGKTAYGVIQGLDCWCTNYAPQDQQDVDSCDQTCPGFPSEFCGSSQKGLYIYVRMENNLSPSGTIGSSQPTSAISQKPSPPPSPPPTTLATSTASPPQSDPVDHAPSTVISLVTTNGVTLIQTVLVSYTPSSTPSTNPKPSPAVTTPPKQGNNTSAIVGGVLGGVIGLALIGGIVALLLWRRRRQQRGEDGSGVQRNTSTMSKSGLISRTEKMPQYPETIATSIRNSRHLDDNGNISPGSGSGKRLDPRLNPAAIMQHANISRGSFVSLDDSRDYGRTLRVANPDSS